MDEAAEDKKRTGSGRLFTSNAFEEALHELENARPAAKKPAPQPSAEEPAQDQAASTKAVSGDADVLQLKKIVEKVDHAEDVVLKFRKDHPYLIAPNVLGLWEVHLKETTVMLQREIARIERQREESA